MSNRLISESSPYLLQHAHNPVDWYPWGEEALARAREEHKPLLVSIGYSACHWCHVMERESFEDVGTADIMNLHFVNIKIDREERPDLDQVFMDAVTAMTGSGGWPLNVFLTPEGKPFFGGTYFPPVRAYNRGSWREVLHSIASTWNERPQEVEAQAENLVAHIQSSNLFGSIGKGAATYTPRPPETLIHGCPRQVHESLPGRRPRSPGHPHHRGAGVVRRRRGEGHDPARRARGRGRRR